MIAVTGGIAEGKSTVLGILRELGYETLSADGVAREIFIEPEVNQLLAWIAKVDPPVTPEVMREVLKNRPEVRRAVNRTLHPRVMERIASSSAHFVEIPLLIETCLQNECDGVWVVTCGKDEQIRRLVERYGESGSGRVLMAAQLPTSSKIPFADEVIRTNQSLPYVWRDVSNALARRFESG